MEIQDTFVVPPEKPQRLLPRFCNEETMSKNLTQVFSPGMSFQIDNEFLSHDPQHLQNGIFQLNQPPPPSQTGIDRYGNGLLPSTVMPTRFPQPERMMMQVSPLAYNHEAERVYPSDGFYLAPSHQQYQNAKQQSVMQGEGKQQANVAGSLGQEDPKAITTDLGQESSNFFVLNGQKAFDIADVEDGQVDRHKLSEKLEEFKDELQELHKNHNKSQISPVAEEHHPPGNTMVNLESYGTSKKGNSFEDFQPVRILHSPEPQTPSRRRVKPDFTEFELTGDFDSQIVYGKTPPVKSLSKPVDLKNSNELVNPESEIKKDSGEAASVVKGMAADDTDFGILSLPDNQFPVVGATKASVSESGQRKMLDVTTADGFDTGISNSMPGIHLSRSSSNPDERSYVSDFETENSPPLEPTSHLPSDGTTSTNNRQSKKNMWRSSSPVTPAVSIQGLLHLMKMVENSFQTVSSSKDEYYRSFQPSDEERERIISEVNNNDGSIIDADPALVSMIVLEQMTVIIRSLSTGCLLPDSLLQSEDLLTLCESDIKSQLPVSSVSLWENLFVHFSCILKHKIMSPKEVSFVFVPCLLQSGSNCQERASKLMTQLLDRINANLFPNSMGIDELSDNSSDESPVVLPQTQQQTMKDKQELVTSIERAFSDGMNDEDTGIDKIGKVKSAELNISHTPAYKNMIFGLMSSISIEEDGNSESESDELEKEFGSTIPDTRQSTGKQSTTSGLTAANFPSVPSATVESTEDDSRDYDFYD